MYAMAGATNYWEGKGRIAISSDGNMHDNDDWSATAMTWLILAKARLHNHVVLYTHSDHVWQSENNDLAEMVESAEGGANRFGFSSSDVFSAFNYPERAYNSMRDQIVASTAENPLFIIGAGPMHVIGTGLDRANKIKPEALNHVTVISHSNWNNNHADNSGSQNDGENYHTGWTWNEMKAEFGSKVNFNKIEDQNGSGSQPYNTDDRWSTTNKSYVDWMKTHPDPNVQWVYSRGGDHKRADYSDAGMAWYLVKNGDQNGDFMKLKAWLGNDLVPTTGTGTPSDPVDPVDPGTPTSISYSATADFGNLSSGAVPYYVDNNRGALAINAANTSFRDKMAKATVTFNGSDGTYTIALTTLAEFDGESDYVVAVNGTEIGSFKNERVAEADDYKQLQFTMENISLKNGDVLSVSSNAVTNGLIPEGTGTAYSRGRWTQLTISGVSENEPTDPGTPVVSDDYTYGANWIAFEAEVTNSNLGEWVIRREGDAKYMQGTRPEGPIGKDYIEFTGNNENGGTANSPLVFKFTAPTTGTYQITGRMLQNLEGAEWDKSNDVYIKLEGDYTSGISGWAKSDLTTNQKFYGRGKDNWGALVKLEAQINGSKQHATPLYNLKKGETYTMTISGRAQRTCIDYFLIFEKSLGLKVGEEVDIATQNDKKYWPTATTNDPVDPIDPSVQEPYSGTPIALPGIIQAQNYDKGGEGVAYHDTDPTNKLAEYRNDGVDIEATGDSQGDYNIGWVATDEWLEYTVEVKKSGDYVFSIRHAALEKDGQITLLLDGTPIVSALALASTGAWQDYASTESVSVNLTAGTYVLRLEVNQGSFNLNYIDVKAVSDSPVALYDTGKTTNLFQVGCSVEVYDLRGQFMGVYQNRQQLDGLNSGVYMVIPTHDTGARHTQMLRID